MLANWSCKDMLHSASCPAGGYGLPRLKNASGFKAYDDFERGVFFEYPRSWVLRDNTLREGLVASDFNARLLPSCFIPTEELLSTPQLDTC